AAPHDGRAAVAGRRTAHRHPRRPGQEDPGEQPEGRHHELVAQTGPRHWRGASGRAAMIERRSKRRAKGSPFAGTEVAEVREGRGRPVALALIVAVIVALSLLG